MKTRMLTPEAELARMTPEEKFDHAHMCLDLAHHFGRIARRFRNEAAGLGVSEAMVDIHRHTGLGWELYREKVRPEDWRALVAVLDGWDVMVSEHGPRGAVYHGKVLYKTPAPVAA